MSSTKNESQAEALRNKMRRTIEPLLISKGVDKSIFKPHIVSKIVPAALMLANCGPKVKFEKFQKLLGIKFSKQDIKKIKQLFEVFQELQTCKNYDHTLNRMCNACIFLIWDYYRNFEKIF